MGKEERPFCCHQNVVLNMLFAPDRGHIHVGKHEKTCIKSDFKEIVLKLAANGQSDKGFLLTSTFIPNGVFCPCPGAIYMYKSIKIYTRTRCQVSVYRTTGPLVVFLCANRRCKKSGSLHVNCF